MFENTQCEACGHALGFVAPSLSLHALTPVEGGFQLLGDTSGNLWRYCDNHQHGACNWLVTGEDQLCNACELNRYIPNLDGIEEKEAWQQLEFAKHRLVYSLLRLNLPVVSKVTSPDGLAFDFISEENQVPEEASTLTGHADGQVTINAAEADAVEREQMREDMNESYRTLIGHFRHEVGHYYWDVLIGADETKIAGFRALFGDEQLDYAEALEQHYATPKADWRDSHISVYASSHPWEDWAETWAHYFHLMDTLETAHALGMSLNPASGTHPNVYMPLLADPYEVSDFDALMSQYLPLTFAVNSLNRGMGQPDLYPFVLVPKVREKLAFVHQLLREGKQ